MQMKFWNGLKRMKQGRTDVPHSQIQCIQQKEFSTRAICIIDNRVGSSLIQGPSGQVKKFAWIQDHGWMFAFPPHKELIEQNVRN
jgi:hypothetical protein